jgi:hypothetical protein
MFEVFLAAANGPEQFAGSRQFAAPPRLGDELILKVAGKRHYYRVIDAFHFERPDGAIAYSVELTWRGPLSSGSLTREPILRLVISNDAE